MPIPETVLGLWHVQKNISKVMLEKNFLTLEVFHGACILKERRTNPMRKDLKFSRILLWILPFLVAMAFLWASIFPMDDPRLENFWPLYHTVLPALLFHLLIGSAGQVLFAMCSGYRLVCFRLLRTQFQSENGRITRRRVREWLPLFDYVLAPPPFADGRFPYLLYCLGSGLTSLGLSGVFALLFLLTRAQPYLALLFGALTLCGLLCAAIFFFPAKPGRLYLPKLLRKNADTRRAYWVQLQVLAHLTQGIRWRDMPAEWFDWDIADSDYPLTIGALILRCAYLTDRHELDAAKELTEALLKLNGTEAIPYHPRLQADLLFFELIGECRMGRLHQLQQPLGGYLETAARQHVNTSVRYAWALLGLRNPGAAQDVRQDFEANASRTAFPGSLPLARELMALTDETAVQRGILPPIQEGR